MENVANNIVIMESRKDRVTEVTWNPAVKYRRNYSQLHELDGYETYDFANLADAVKFAKQLAIDTGLPLYVSNKYLNRAETHGLKML
jgi:hypothetical protein